MKQALLATCILLLAFAAFTNANPQASAYRLRPVDETKKWAYPYKADAERSRQILQGAKLAERFRLSIQEAVAQLGKPDMVEDLRKRFQGLSPEEDSLM